VTTAVALPALALTPLVISDPHGVSRVINWHSLPGLGGLSLLAQPDLAKIWLLSSPVDVHLSGFSHTLQGHLGQVLLGFPLVAAALLLARRRASAIEGASLLWLTVFSFSVNFGPRYVLWGLPFLLMGRSVGKAIVIQAIVAVPNVLLYLAPFHSSDAVSVYVSVMLATWAIFLASAVIVAWQVADNSDRWTVVHPRQARRPAKA